MSDWTSRTVGLLSEEGAARLADAAVAVIGLGGVGSYAAEALCRCGIGALHLYDGDTVSESNRNRQLFATCDTVGLPKTEAAKRRLQAINPDCRLTLHQVFITADTVLDLGGIDYIIDAIDTVSAKLTVIGQAYRLGIPVISAMGTGNKLDAARLEVSDISATSVCPLARVMRRELRARGITHLPVVYSKEEPRRHAGEMPERVPASAPFVPGAAGLILAGEVVKALALAEKKH